MYLSCQKRLLLLLEYRLLPLPLSLAHPDGSRRTCAKMQTYRNNKTFVITSTIHLYRGNGGKYIIDLMATLRTFNTIPETYELVEADTKIYYRPYGYTENFQYDTRNV